VLRDGIDPRTVARAYGFPRDLDARGQTVALIELGGGFRRSDLEAFAAWRGFRLPPLSVKGIDGHRNRPAPRDDISFVLQTLGLPASTQLSVSRRDSSSPPPKPGSPASPAIGRERALAAMWTIETTMDIELVAALARGAAIEVYFAPGTAHGQYHAFTAALDSPGNPSVISGSFGSCEDELPPSYLHAMTQVFQLAALKGVTVCVSSGDRGDDAKDGRPRAHFPASSPHVLSCGGTHMDPASPFPERVWEEPGMPSLKSGGGVSAFFAEPAWQSRARVQQKTGHVGRGVPDVAAKADLHTGYGIVVRGLRFSMGGTSASAPLWAALVATLNRRLSLRIGYLTPLLYSRRFSRAARDVTRGSNGAFRAVRGWDACTGWGSPDGTALRRALEGH
jgi:kumamolisin